MKSNGLQAKLFSWATQGDKLGKTIGEDKKAHGQATEVAAGLQHHVIILCFTTARPGTFLFARGNRLVPVYNSESRFQLYASHPMNEI